MWSLPGGWRSGVRKVAWYYGMLESEGEEFEVRNRNKVSCRDSSCGFGGVFGRRSGH